MDDDLPLVEVIEMVGPPNPISDAEILRRRQLQPENSDIAAAEALCTAGHVPAATASIKRLLQTDTRPRQLSYCLLGAILAWSDDLVQMLVDAGVPPNLGDVKAAIRQNSPPMLALFLQHGWNINEQEDKFLPPLLS